MNRCFTTRWASACVTLASLLVAASAFAEEVHCIVGDREGRCSKTANLSGEKFVFTVAGCTAVTAAEIQVREEEPAKCIVSGGRPATLTCPLNEEQRAARTGELSIGLTCDARRVTLSVRIAGGPDTVASGQKADGMTGEAEDPDALPFLAEATWQRVMREIGVSISGTARGSYYSRSGDLAVLFFDADGEAYFPIPDVIDEDDDIFVIIVDTPTRLAELSLATSGCSRPPVEPRVYAPAVAGRATASKGFRAAAFIVRALGKCAGAESGGPRVTFERAGRQQTKTIPVNPLYRLAVGVAAAYDGSRQRDFTLSTLPGETVPRIAESNERLGLTSLVHISFYPVARDFRKTDFLLLQRAQLFVGLDPRAFDRHLVGGVGYELTAGLNLLFGWRFVTKQKVLREGSGLTPGTPFDGNLSDLPTRDRLERGGIFFGVGLSNHLLSRFE